MTHTTQLEQVIERIATQTQDIADPNAALAARRAAAYAIFVADPRFDPLCGGAQDELADLMTYIK